MLIAVKILIVIMVLFLGVAGNLLFYSFKSVLRREGYPTSRFFGFWGDIPDFLEVIRKESDPAKKRHYQQLFFGLVLTTVLFLGLSVIMICLL